MTPTQVKRTYERVIGEVSKAVGYKGHIEVEVIPNDPLNPALVQVLPSSHPLLQGTEDSLTIMGPAIKGIIAHELGHLAVPQRFDPLEVVFGIRNAELNKQREQEADEFAARHGYGELFIDALRKVDALEAGVMINPLAVKDVMDDHGSMDERMAWIKAAEPKERV